MERRGVSNEGILDGPVSPGVRTLWQHYYHDYRPRLFEELVYQRVRTSDSVLEIGAGSGRGNQKHFELLGRVTRYVGIDPDPRVLTNPYLDQGYVGTAESLPFADACFDLVFHSHVAEHFESPMNCNREISRVLRPGGLLLFVTPSRFYYAMLAAKLTPHWFHAFYVRHFGSGRTADDVFPIWYRLNDDKSITEQLGSCGFDVEIQHHRTPPGYLRFSRLSFLAGVLIERTLERRFPSLRELIIVVAKKRV